MGSRPLPRPAPRRPARSAARCRRTPRGRSPRGTRTCSRGRARRVPPRYAKIAASGAWLVARVRSFAGEKELADDLFDGRVGHREVERLELAEHAFDALRELA